MKISMHLEALEVSRNLYLRQHLSDFEMGEVKGKLSIVLPSGSLHIQITEPVKACYLLQSSAVVAAIVDQVQS